MLKNVSPVKVIGLLFLIAGIGLAFFHLHPAKARFHDFINAFYANFSAEFISIAVTILLIDYLYEVKELKNLKKRLVRELGNEQKGISSRALQELRENGWLSDGSLANADFRNANLSGLDFTGADLRNVNLTSADLDRAIFKDANLSNADLSNAKLRAVNMENCNLNNAKLHRANMYEAILNKVKTTGTDFMNVNLELAEIVEAIFTTCKFDDVNLKLTNLARSKFIDSNFLRADFESCTVKQASFERCDIQNIKNWENILDRNPNSFSSPRNEPQDFFLTPSI